MKLTFVKVQYARCVVIIMLCSYMWVLCSLPVDNSDSPSIEEQSQ